MKAIKFLVGLVLIALVGYFFASPYLTAYKIKEAVAKGDGKSLASYVDFEALRQSFKDQLSAIMASEMKDGSADDPFAGLGALFSGAMIDKMIDAYVTPEGLSTLIKREGPALGEEGSAKGGKTSSASKVSMSYESLNRFIITIKGDTVGQDMKVVLERSGFAWKVTEIRLPAQA